MDKIIGLKELRENVNLYVDQVKRGASFIVVKRSKPIFKISPLDDETNWETAVDFTKIKKGGVPLEDLLTRL